jgi:hypothetical protein
LLLLLSSSCTSISTCPVVLLLLLLSHCMLLLNDQLLWPLLCSCFCCFSCRRFSTRLQVNRHLVNSHCCCRCATVLAWACHISSSRLLGLCHIRGCIRPLLLLLLLLLVLLQTLLLRPLLLLVLLQFLLLRPLLLQFLLLLLLLLLRWRSSGPVHALRRAQAITSSSSSSSSSSGWGARGVPCRCCRCPWVHPVKLLLWATGSINVHAVTCCSSSWTHSSSSSSWTHSSSSSSSQWPCGFGAGLCPRAQCSRGCWG